MKPQLSDTVFDRYTLVERLRAQPGLEAWKANDRVLAQDCQLFFITAREALDSVDRVASSLVISSNDRFTQVLQSRREDDCTVLVTRLDSGQSLSDYLEQVDDRDGQPGKPLSYDAMRSILGDVAYALTSTREGMISTDTIRISTAGVEVADAPLAALAEEPSGADALTMGERLVVRQLAAVLYAMLTHTPSSKIDRYDFSRLPINMPGEFQVILRRGLNLTSEGGHVEPMASLAEFKALLGYWRTVPDLSYEHDLALPSEASEPSIVQLPLRHVDDDQVAEVPASMLTAEPLPELTIEDAVSAQPSPTYMPTAAINVSHLSILEAEPMGVGESTTVIPLFDESMASSSADEAEPAFDGDTADDDGGTDTAFAMDMPGADGLQPPSFTPAVAHRNTPDEPEDGLEDLSDEPLFGKFTTKVIAIVVGAVLLLLALVFAMISLTHSDMNPPTDRSTNWPDQNTEDVPFGDSANSSDSTDPAATASAATDDATWFIQTQDSHGWLA